MACQRSGAHPEFRQFLGEMFAGMNSLHSVSYTHLSLVITIQPDEGFDLNFQIKEPGDEIRLDNRRLHFRYSEAFAQSPEAYETLLLDVMKGDATLFVRDDEVEASWKLYTPLLERRPKVVLYAAGSSGPPEADRLLTDLDCNWNPL